MIIIDLHGIECLAQIGKLPNRKYDQRCKGQEGMVQEFASGTVVEELAPIDPAPYFGAEPGEQHGDDKRHTHCAVSVAAIPNKAAASHCFRFNIARQAKASPTNRPSL